MQRAYELMYERGFPGTRGADQRDINLFFRMYRRIEVVKAVASPTGPVHFYNQEEGRGVDAAV